MRRRSLAIRIMLFALGFLAVNLGMEVLTKGQTTPDFLVSAFVGGVFMAVMLAWIRSQTRLTRLGFIAVFWFTLFIIQMFNNLLEALFFTQVFSSTRGFLEAVCLSMFTVAVEASMAGILFTSEGGKLKLSTSLHSYFDRKSFSSWSWRIAAASLAYFPVYLFFGMLVSPFVIPYYMDPSLGLRLPPFTVIVPFEFLRGFLYVISLLPVLASIKRDRKTLYLAVASLLYVAGAFIPLILEHSLPLAIVPVHCVELLADSLVYGWIVTRLLY